MKLVSQDAFSNIGLHCCSYASLHDDALEITVCDCSNASNLGLLSLATPEFCDSRAVIEQPVEVEYGMFAEEK